MTNSSALAIVLATHLTLIFGTIAIGVSERIPTTGPPAHLRLGTRKGVVPDAGRSPVPQTLTSQDLPALPWPDGPSANEAPSRG